MSDIENKNKAKQSKNILKEYRSFKNMCSDSILLFQIGDFFEAWFEDAEKLSKASGAVLSSRFFKEEGLVPQSGFPQRALTNYLKKLLQENYKVAVCKQFKDEQLNCYREIVRIYTKGTLFEQEFLDSVENNYICAIHCDDDNYNLAYADVSTGQCYTTSGNRNDILIELEKIEPNELLLSEQQKEKFKNITPVYNCTLLNEVFFKNKNPFDVLMKYCEHTQKNFKPLMDKVLDYNFNSYMIMDEITRRSLELTRTKRFLKHKGSLFWFLNQTQTPMGTRLLKKYLNEPLLNRDLINLRLDAVEELINNKHLLEKIDIILKKFCDLSRICAHISNSTICPKELYSIAQNTFHLEELIEICAELTSPLLKLSNENINEILNLARNIKKAINQNAPNELKSGNIIKDDYNADLDYYRFKTTSIYENIRNLENFLQKKLEIKKLKIVSSSTLGYYIEIPNGETQKIPTAFSKKQALTNCSRYTNADLKELEDNLFNLKYRSNELEYTLYCEIRKQATNYVEKIRELAKEIAIIDVLSSFAKCAIANNFTRPRFKNNGIKIKDGYHPSLLKLNNDIVKNDSDIKDGSMIILTGANMSGKSTYLKQNAIICLLSQIGSFVPASEANLTLIDKIFIRQGSTDDIINNNSSFMVEMIDLNFILNNMTNNSLILLDEPAKSTNENEGGAIARAFCEYILEKYSTKALIATHNLKLTGLENDYPERVFNYVIGNSEFSEEFINNRKIKRGVINSSMALNTAILAQLPEEIITCAKKYLN